MPRFLIALILSLCLWPAHAAGSFVKTPYASPKVVFEIYLDNPGKLGNAINWVRNMTFTLSQPPYTFDPKTLKVVMHGVEIQATVKEFAGNFPETVEKMRALAEQGVEFKVCNYAREQYGYTLDDFQDFIQVVPSAIVEVAYWQNQGYALMTPQVFFRD